MDFKHRRIRFLQALFLIFVNYKLTNVYANESAKSPEALKQVQDSSKFHHGDLSHHLDRTARQYQSSQGGQQNTNSQWNTPYYNNYNQNNWNSAGGSNWGENLHEGSGSDPQKGYDQGGWGTGYGEDDWDLQSNSGDGPIDLEGSGAVWPKSEEPGVIQTGKPDIQVVDEDTIWTTPTPYRIPETITQKPPVWGQPVLTTTPEIIYSQPETTTSVYVPPMVTDRGMQPDDEYPGENDVSIDSHSHHTPSMIDSFWQKINTQPGLLAAVIGGACIGLLCAILLAMFLVYRMRKKDEGSYALDEPALYRKPGGYMRAPTSDTAISKEYYA